MKKTISKQSQQEFPEKCGTLINFSPSKSSQGFKSFMWESVPTNNEVIKQENLDKSQFYSSSFNSHEIYLDTEVVEEKNQNTPKIANFNKNNLILKREITIIDGKIKSTDFEAFLLIAKYFFSVGILALPYMFHLTGYILGSLLIVFTSGMTIYSVHLIIEVHEVMQSRIDPSQVKQTTSISELAFKIFGSTGQLTCRIFSTISNLGSCISYIIFFEIYISSIIQEQWSHKISNEQAHLIGAFFAFAVILPLSAVNNITLFWQTNLIGFFLGFVSILCMLYLDLSLILGTGGIMRSDNDLWRTDQFFIALGISVYSFQIMGISLNVRNSMEKPGNFFKVFNTSTILTCILYLLFGIITQFAMGEYAQDIVLLNFAPQTLTGFFVRILYTISILLSYPLKFYVVIQIYENLKFFKERIFCQEKYDLQEYSNTFSQQIAQLKRYGIRYIIIVLIFILSLTTYKLAKIISLVGSLGSIILQFVIPQVIYMKYFNVSWQRIIYGIFICMLFTMAACIGVYRSLQGLIESQMNK